MPFLAAAVLAPSPLAVLRSAGGAVGAVDDELGVVAGPEHFAQIRCRTRRELDFAPQGLPENRRQAVNPLVRLSLAEAEPEGQNFLRRVVPEVKQDKEEFVFARRQDRFAASAWAALAGFLAASPQVLFVGFLEGGKQLVKFRNRQPG